MNNRKRLSDLDHVRTDDTMSVFNKINNDGVNCAVWLDAVPEDVIAYFDSLNLEEIQPMIDATKAFIFTKRQQKAKGSSRIGIFKKTTFGDSFNERALEKLPVKPGVTEAKKFLTELSQQISEAIPEGYKAYDVELRFNMSQGPAFHIDAIDYRFFVTLSSPEEGVENSTYILPNSVAQDEIAEINKNAVLKIKYQNLKFENMKDQAIPTGHGNVMMMVGRQSGGNGSTKQTLETYPLFHSSPNIPYRKGKRLRTSLVITVQ